VNVILVLRFVSLFVLVRRTLAMISLKARTGRAFDAVALSAAGQVRDGAR
jgi:hypothetical protein